MSNQIYFCTRPKLASYLMENGYEGKSVINPFDSKHRMAWTFKTSPELTQLINEYFKGVD